MIYAIVFCFASSFGGQQCEIKTHTYFAGWQGYLQLTREKCLETEQYLNSTQASLPAARFVCVKQDGETIRSIYN